jgi:hypothetical protein
MATAAIGIKRRLNPEVENVCGYADLTEEAKHPSIAETYEGLRPPPVLERG